MLGASLVVDLVEWIEPAFVTAGYLIIAGAVLLERSIFVGLVVPGDFILALGGVYASRGDLELGVVIAIGIVCAIIGESAGYWIGRKFGLTLIGRIPLIRRLKPKLENAQDYFGRHGGKTVVIGRYATAAGAFVPFSAGVGRMPYWRFLLFDVPSVAVWAVAIAVFGYAFGTNLEFIDRALSRFGLIVLGLIVMFFLARFLLGRRRARKERLGGTSGPGDDAT